MIPIVVSEAGPARLREASAPNARPLTVAAGPLTAVDESPGAARDIAATCTAWYLSRHRHHPAATRHALAQHRSDPPGSSAGRPAGGAPRRSPGSGGR